MADVRFSVTTHWCVIVYVLSTLFIFGQTLDLSCIEVKKEYIKMGFRDDSNIPLSAIPGEDLQICPQGSTCCTADMEEKLQSLSMKEYETVSNTAFRFMKSTFVSRTKKFDEFFTELLEKSKRDLHEMFVRTYGLLYQQNAEVFSNLFRDLKLYYKGSNLNLVDILNKFFVKLLQRMFELLNAQYIFDNDYLKCVTRHMDDLKPFGDVPIKLKLQVKRAFIAARTFVQGLAIGRDVILAMERVKPTEACTRGITRMMFCPLCQGLTRTKACNNYCLNTMKGCLANHSELNKAWNEYIEALKMVALRLEGPFNIETVVEPIDVKISEAIMNFQEDATTVTERIFKGCGSPRRAPNNNGRFKRQGGEGETSYEDYAYGKDFLANTRGSKEERPDTAAGTNLDRLVKDIKEKVQEAKDFWLQLPYSICNSEIAAQPGEEENCWNGVDRARYVHEVQKDGRIYQVNNPEVTVNVQEDNGIISVQIENLKLITGKLHNAYNGFEVEGANVDIDVDGSGDDLEGSGMDGNRKYDEIESSGDGVYSGSGSGMQPDDEDFTNTNKNKKPVRPTGPTKTDDIGFIGNKPNTVNPTYNVNTKQNQPTKKGGVSATTSSVILLSSTLVVLRLVL